jgi:curved DNA-binding protein CbpA
MSLERDYALLEVEPGASPEQIRRAYLDLVKVWHPDRFPNDPDLTAKADQRLMEINLAYERLRAWTANESAAQPPGTVPAEHLRREPNADVSDARPRPVDETREFQQLTTTTKINVTLATIVVGSGLFTAGLLVGQLHV